MRNNRVFRAVAWAAISIVAVFLGKDFVLSVVDVATVMASQA